jgi:DNA-binding transcriptional LysR family regulator
LIGYVEEHAFSSALDYVRELFGGAPTSFESANAATQLEAVRSGVGLGVVHDFIARRFKDLVRVLPERRATRAYWLVTHEDTRGLGRIRAVAEHLAQAVTRDRGDLLVSVDRRGHPDRLRIARIAKSLTWAGSRRRCLG